MAAAIPLGQAALVDPVTTVIALAALTLLLITKIEVAWIILASALAALVAA